MSKAAKLRKTIFVSIGAAILLAYVLFPFVWLLLCSVKMPVELFSKPPELLPRKPYFGFYATVLHDRMFVSSVWNSLLVSVFTTLASLFLGTLAAYAFARFRFPARNGLYLTILATQMLPQMALLIPLFVLLRSIGLLYSYAGLILAYMSFSVPYVVWMLRAFFISVPAEIEEAARVDGCSRLQSILRVVVPISAPGLVATAVFVFIGAWNEFLYATTMTNAITKTFTVRLAEFVGEERIAFELMFPAAVLGTLPPLLLAVLFQRYVVKGLSEGGVKW